MDRILTQNDRLKAVIRTYDQIADGDSRADRNDSPPGHLAGLSVAVKDNLAVAGAPWTAGIGGRRRLLAEYDATAVRRVRQAGAVVLASTNLEEAALGAVTDNPVFGRCINPLADGFTAGGSSGGSAAAVAAGFADLALGTDTLGSVRIPASYCGVYGLKPTYGLVGRAGLVFLAPSLDTIGVLTGDASLLWPAVDALAAEDPGDPNSRLAPVDWRHRPVPGLEGLGFGVPTQLAKVDLEPEVSHAFSTVVDTVRALGATVSDVELRGWQPRSGGKAGLIIIEAEAALELADLMAVDGALSDSLRAMLAFGRDLPSAKLMSALKQTQAVADGVERAFSDFDALILPTTPQRAFRHGTPLLVNQADLTALANFAGCPAVAIPVAVPGSALPASVQIIGPKWSEARLTVWAETLASALSDGPSVA